MNELIANLPEIMVCLIVCGAKILEISIQSVKVVFMVKGKKVLASLLAFSEAMVWGLVVSSVIAILGSNFNLLFAYCIGYAMGLYIGSLIENWIAVGTSNIEIIVNKEHIDAVESYLKEQNRGYTVLDGHGSREKTFVVIMVLPRKKVKKTMETIKSICNDKVFEISSDITKSIGGYAVKV